MESAIARVEVFGYATSDAATMGDSEFGAVMGDECFHCAVFAHFCNADGYRDRG
jgi:hypothetical protein